MKIGIISDSHDSHAGVLKAVEIFKEEKVDYILHAGDIVSPFTARAFANVENATFIAVFGNNDGEKLFLASTIQSFGGQIHENVLNIEIDGKKIFMTHVPSTIEDVIASGHYDLVIYGHTHRQDIRKVGNTLVINPGESTDWITGKSSVVILDLSDMHYRVVKIK